MEKKLERAQFLNVALMGGDSYARHGITALLHNIAPETRIVISAGDYRQLDNALKKCTVDILLLSGVENNRPGFDCLEYIKKIRINYPQMMICMYSVSSGSLLWVRGDIDAYISLQLPIYQWRSRLQRMIGTRYQREDKPVVLSLTPGEWRVLKELKNGLDIRYIAEREKLSYRRVSALKNSAIRKLGLRNKTDLLVFLTS